MSEIKVYESIANACAELAKIGISKERKNQQQGYAFRGIDDVYSVLAPILSANKLAIIPRFVKREMTEHITQKGGTLFRAVVEGEFDIVSALDGSKHTARMFGEAMDSGDKATNKAMSAAYKYLAFQLFCIPTEGDNDADATTPEPVIKAQGVLPPPRGDDVSKRATAPPRERGKVVKAAEVLPLGLVATEQDRLKMLGFLSDMPGSELREYAIDRGYILDNEMPSDWNLGNVPTTPEGLNALKADINEWRFLSPGQEPGPTFDAAHQPWFKVIVPVPNKGQKRDDYLKNPDTIGSLYERMKQGDEEAQRRLWGFANNYEAKGWIGNDGKPRPPSKTDITFREALDQFLGWHDAQDAEK